MSLKKNWFAWIVWAVYSIMLCSFLATYINAQCTILKFGKYATILTVCLAGTGILGIYRLLCLVYEKWGSIVRKVSSRSRNLLEVFSVMVLFAGAVLVRIENYVSHSVTFYGTTDFYVMATAEENGGMSSVVHGASYLYTGMLSVLLALFDNELVAGIVIQIVLQLIGILLFYFAVRNLTGRMEAVISMAVLAFFPSMVNYSFTLMPENLYFCLFSAMLLFIGLYKRYEEKKERKLLVSASFLSLIGIGTGYMMYLDVIGILLFAGLCFAVVSGKSTIGRKIFGIFTAAGVSVLFLCVMFLTEAVLKSETFFKALFSWWNLYFSKCAWNYMIAGPDITLVCSLVICAGAAWCIFSFLRQKEYNGCFYMLSLVILALFVSFGSRNMSYQLLITAFWAVLAALGVTSVMFVKETAEEEENVRVLTVNEISCSNKEATDKKQIQYIENPLPLPKKHIKKTMDYKFEPEEHLMKYDIEVSEDDDFDL